LTIKDAFPIVSVVYYATPLPAMTFAATLAGLRWTWLKKPRLASISLAVALLCAWLTFQHSYFTNPDRPSSSDRCVVFWNVSSSSFGWAGIVTTLRSQDPDIIGLVEIGGTGSDDRNRWQEAFPNYELTDAQDGMLLMSKGRIVELSSGPLGQGGRYKLAKVESAGGTLHVFLVDVLSAPLMFRREPLEELSRITAQLGDVPILLIGDFNTPGDSVHFDSLRRTFVNAFESHGDGYAATWPVPLPVLQLDHIWANRRLSISKCSTRWTFRSDHRPVIAWIRPD
jgi:endonuclease/exonuclease/phosphatase (EEP) superfamily protein YafD